MHLFIGIFTIEYFNFIELSLNVLIIENKFRASRNGLILFLNDLPVVGFTWTAVSHIFNLKIHDFQKPKPEHIFIIYIVLALINIVFLLQFKLLNGDGKNVPEFRAYFKMITYDMWY